MLILFSAAVRRGKTVKGGRARDASTSTVKARTPLQPSMKKRKSEHEPPEV